MIKRFNSYYRTYKVQWREILHDHDRRNIIVYDLLWVLTGKF